MTISPAAIVLWTMAIIAIPVLIVDRLYQEKPKPLPHHQRPLKEKQQLARLLREGGATYATIAKQLGCSISTAYRWSKSK